jgi:hypothetical protein
VIHQGFGEIVQREKLVRLHVVAGRGAREDLLQVDSKFLRVERPAFAQFLSGDDDFIPGFHAVGCKLNVER